MEPGDKVCEELKLWIRAYELAGCYDQLQLRGNASLEYVARFIQSFVDALSDSASVDWSNQKLFVTSLRAGEGKLPVKKRRNVNSIRASDGSSGGASRGAPSFLLCLHLDLSGLLGRGKGKKKGTPNAASAWVAVPPEPTA